MRLIDPDRPALSRFSGFGLRLEWVELFLSRPSDWASTGLLGPRQVDAFRTWLRVSWLVDDQEIETPLARDLRTRGLRDLATWQLIWVSIAYRFTTANWYCRLEHTKHSTSELRDMLQTAYPLSAPRTVSNGIYELASTLERTPIGGQLGQGHVCSGTPRIIVRKPTVETYSLAIWCAFALLLCDSVSCISLSEDLCWPWMVLGCDPESVLTTIRLYGEDKLVEDDGVLHLVRPTREWNEWCVISTTYR